ncbi:hypothetical protein [Microvirga sp. VF16]|uniref:hypothetical protein n=1 Tax=Microvirga sp. VF16 TaxID=2807101 RepID=UPI00193D87E3|nr:hypothetical protein JO965_25690 [Microvirga sp. VF16]
MYGDNGSRKTTFSRLLDCLKTGSHDEYPERNCSLGSHPRIPEHNALAAWSRRVALHCRRALPCVG